MNREAFEELVAKAVEGLPNEFTEQLDNVAIVVEDVPTRRQLGKGERGMTLLGLYEGVPLTARSHDYGMVLPDKITIFQKPIEASCRSEGEIVVMVQSVVRHEIAHHFGISDERLDELEDEEEEDKL
jgi:predicted Zn-dependent protease with MMP-like domain